MSISLEALKEAVQIHEYIASLEVRLQTILGGGDVSSPVLKSTKKGRRKMSASAKIAAAQRARWAKQNGTSPVVKPAKKKRYLSAAGRARIIAAQKKRWSAKKK